jgi:hypothetical protein
VGAQAERDAKFAQRLVSTALIRRAKGPLPVPFEFVAARGATLGAAAPRQDATIHERHDEREDADPVPYGERNAKGCAWSRDERA